MNYTIGDYENLLATAVHYLLEGDKQELAFKLSLCRISSIFTSQRCIPDGYWDDPDIVYQTLEIIIDAPSAIYEEFLSETEESKPPIVEATEKAFKAIFSNEESVIVVQAKLEVLNVESDWRTKLSGRETTRREKTSKLTIFGCPSTAPQFQCDIFVIMPFAEEFKPVYESVIKPLESDSDLNLKKGIKRGDDFFSHHNIMEEIWSALNACQIVIADCTGRNAYVFYELGIAHTLGKPYILITQDVKDAPFDIQGRRLIEYKDSIAGTEKLRADLKKAILALMSELGER
ncbi:MAG TPA: hypothetical protein VHO69_11775 [Phototrophicaceae bacterium]|nr:hypothetical protein [Phototrophicaceae bacterium]